MMIRIENFHFRAALEITGGDFAFAFGFQREKFFLIGVEFHADAFEIQDQIGGIFVYSGNR